MNIAADRAFAERLADAAGAAIKGYFRKRYDVETKADLSPVTAADRAAEAAMRAILEKERPEEGIIGEEYGSHNAEAERIWVLDPIDGTRSFLAGRPIFGTLIALLEAGEPIVGIIDQPIVGDRWSGARGQPTMHSGNAAATRACADLGRALVATSGPQYFSADQRARFEGLAAAAGQLLYGGDCYNYGLLASGHVDIVVEAGLKLHDFAALAPVVVGAGGSMTDWEGRPLTGTSDGRVIALGDRRLLERVQGFLR